VRSQTPEEGAMSRRDGKRKARAFTAEQKLRILQEARAPNTTVAEVLRRHRVDATTFYRWERQAEEGMREALQGRRKKNGKAQAREIERLEVELEKKRRIIAEVVEENLELKEGL
jgi:transposase-like protein